MLNNWHTDNPPAWAYRVDNGDARRNRQQTARERARAAGWPNWAAEVEAAVTW